MEVVGEACVRDVGVASWDLRTWDVEGRVEAAAGGSRAGWLPYREGSCGGPALTGGAARDRRMVSVRRPLSAFWCSTLLR